MTAAGLSDSCHRSDIQADVPSHRGACRPPTDRSSRRPIRSSVPRRRASPAVPSHCPSALSPASATSDQTAAPQISGRLSSTHPRAACSSSLRVIRSPLQLPCHRPNSRAEGRPPPVVHRLKTALPSPQTVRSLPVHRSLAVAHRESRQLPAPTALPSTTPAPSCRCPLTSRPPPSSQPRTGTSPWTTAQPPPAIASAPPHTQPACRIDPPVPSDRPSGPTTTADRPPGPTTATSNRHHADSPIAFGRPVAAAQPVRFARRATRTRDRGCIPPDQPHQVNSGRERTAK